MEGKYIFAIVILSLFFVLILVSFAFLEFERKKEEKRQNWIIERYADSNVNKPDYDNVVVDEEIQVNNAQPEEEKVEAVEEEIPDNVQLSLEDAYGKIETEGIEEITGNYDGGNK